MKLTIELHSLSEYLAKQLQTFYPDGVPVKDSINKIMPTVIERLDYCFSHIRKKYYFDEGQAVFNHLNSDHYAMFLYFVANEAYRQQFINVAEKAFLLNKALHGIDAFYSIALPNVFLFVHPIGTILGNAHYSDFLVVYQNVTVGTDVNSVYPRFGEAVVLYAKSSVIGKCDIGNNVSIAGNTFIRNTDVPDDSVAVGFYPEVRIKKNSKNNKYDFFLNQ
ncbi:serine acetyltransferase [Legionella feeleii]|uniref:Serine acetyltransferase n=1 Tax=Legionella feeleii TaxID=453 RepID=A0A0W0U143_9GAMM|nr:serine acetyltransferase [Legionella feeleii]KTD01473.1 Serine acetyltransferase [Legionella feeleii]SPX61283.1 Serine acetyltransferase [Legionella feeleii]